jgi:hypothetical protein
MVHLPRSPQVSTFVPYFSRPSSYETDKTEKNGNCSSYDISGKYRGCKEDKNRETKTKENRGNPRKCETSKCINKFNIQGITR